MRLLKLLGRMIAQVIVFLTFFIGLGILVVVARKSITAASSLYWAAGVALSVTWLCAVCAIIISIWYALKPNSPVWLKKYVLIRRRTDEDAGLAEQFPVATLSALICASLLVAVYALVEMSCLLYAQGLIKYGSVELADTSFRELLFRFYLWHAIDMIPLIDICQIYDLKPQLKPTDFWAQTIVLVFRSLIVTFAISAIVQWAKSDRDEIEHSTEG